MKNSNGFLKHSSRCLRWLGIFFFITISLMKAGANGSQTATLKVQASPTGGGKVYVTHNSFTKPTEETNSATSGDLMNNSGNSAATFYVWADSEVGYQFLNWTGESTNSNIPNTQFSLRADETNTTSKTYTATANFQRIKIDIGTATWTPSTILTWKNRTVNGKITVPVTNAIATNDFTNNGFGLTSPHFSTPTIEWSGTAGGSGTVTISTTYTLQADGYYKPGFNLVAAPGREDPTPGETTTLNQVIEIPVDLTPAFTIPNTTLPTTAEGKSSTVTIHPADYGELPLERVTWTASISGTDATCFTTPTNPTNGSCTITYQPTAIGTHTATLTLHASYTDAHRKEWTHEQTCTLSGECIEDRDPELYIQKGGVTQSTALYEFPTTGSTTATFDVASLGVAYITAVSANESLVKPTLSVDSKTLTLAINSLSTQGTQNVVITVSGQATIGENVGSTVSATLTVTIHRWFKDITVTATPDATSMVLKWTSAGPEVTSYQILRGSTVLATVDKNTLTYTDKGPLTADKSYTYTIKALSSGANYSVNASFKTAVASSFLRLDNCPEMRTITNVDASAAFQSDGTALMDRLYIMNKNNAARCHIYDKYDDKSYKLQKTVDPRAAAGRVGRIENKKIYIAGTCESLYWNTGDYLGWMQPVNCNIYLDNARLRTAYSKASKTIFKQTINLMESDNTLEIDLTAQNKYNSSIFFITEGDTYIHTKGKNYLSGNLGHLLFIALTVHVDATITDFDRTINNYLANYCAPITIKGGHLFDGYEQPIIKCIFDAEWADGGISNGYLDLATRICQHQDSSTIKNDYLIDGLGEDARINWTYHKGYRYTSPLNTGGPNGYFIINGGHINLWPANGHSANVEVNNLAGAGTMGGVFAQNLSVIGGKLANYLVCGNNKWSLECNETVFNLSGETQLHTAEGKKQQSSSDLIIDEINKFPEPPTAITYGAGNGIPEGHLIINGGTISANTDPNSFAYKWTDYDMTQKTSTVKTSQNVADDGSGQPLFGPNVEINGGTFLHPLYGTTNHGTGSALHKASYNRDGLNPISQWNNNGILDYIATDFKAKNLHAQSVSRAEYALPEANTDYTAFNEINTTTEPEAHNPSAEEGKKAVIGNVGTAQEYLYGMTNVWSDDKALGYFYLPSGNSGIMQNYYVQSGETVSTFDLTQSSVTTPYHPYHLWIDKGGEISVADDYVIHGRPHYRATYTEDIYQTIAMPFTATKFFVTDPWDDQFQFYSYVEVDDANAAGVSEADRIAINNNAYCYLYFLDDEATNSAEDDDIVHDQRATGVNNTFRSYYHTHTDGSTMQAGKTYVIKFPKVDDTNYWGTNTVTLQGEKGDTILGKNGFTFDRPEATANDALNPSFIMDGNTTFATQDISKKGEVYLVDPAQWGNDSFHATTVSTLAPMQGYLVGSTTTMQRYRIIGREGKVEQTALDQLIHTGWTAVGAHQAMLIMTPQDATAHIYTAEGKLWKTISLTANTGVVVNAPAGFYIVHTGNESKKVLVH